MKDPIQKIVIDIMEKIPSMEPWVAAQVRDAVVEGLKKNIQITTTQISFNVTKFPDAHKDKYIEHVKRDVLFRLIEHVKEHVHENEYLSDLEPVQTSTLYVVRKP